VSRVLSRPANEGPWGVFLWVNFEKINFFLFASKAYTIPHFTISNQH
jgi:hypothetical protein